MCVASCVQLYQAAAGSRIQDATVQVQVICFLQRHVFVCAYSYPILLSPINLDKYLPASFSRPLQMYYIFSVLNKLQKMQCDSGIILFTQSLCLRTDG